MTAVTGVSGSGKSTLVNDILYRALARALHGASEKPGAHDKIEGIFEIDKVIDIDQAPIGRTPRSNPATYTNVFNPIRELMSRTPEARARGYQPGRFSFNVKGGRCEACAGDGQIKIEMHFLPDIYVTCDVCGGKRYNRETLQVHYKGKSIADILALTAEQALELFANVPPVANICRTLVEVGLGYIQLGQSSTTLSGGEAQRVKLARELARRSTGRTLYLLDEPTTGLHFDDIQKLLGVLRLPDREGQHGDRDRAQPRRDPDGRLGHRPRARGRRRRRPDRRARERPRRSRTCKRLPHRPVPAADARPGARAGAGVRRARARRGRSVGAARARAAPAAAAPRRRRAEAGRRRRRRGAKAAARLLRRLGARREGEPGRLEEHGERRPLGPPERQPDLDRADRAEALRGILAEEIVVDGKHYEKAIGRGEKGTLEAAWGKDRVALDPGVARPDENPTAATAADVWRLQDGGKTWTRQTRTIQVDGARDTFLVFRQASGEEAVESRGSPFSVERCSVDASPPPHRIASAAALYGSSASARSRAARAASASPR